MSVLQNELINYRKQNKLSQEELADKLGVGRYQVASWEVGRTKPRKDTLLKISELLCCTVSYLQGVEDSTGSNIIELAYFNEQGIENEEQRNQIRAFVEFVKNKNAK